MIKMISYGYDKTYKGLDNSMGANNWFLNVVIQSLWHLASFRKVFKNQPLHKHKKGKTEKRKKKRDNYGGYPDLESSGGYPSIEPMAGMPEIYNPDEPESYGGGYPSFDAPNGGNSMHVPTAGDGRPSYESGPAYVDPNNAAYPSLDGVPEKKFHINVKIPDNSDRKYKYAAGYPSFDKGGNIISDEYEPSASTQMPYRSSTMSKPDREVSLEEAWLFCNLLTLFVNYEFDDSNVLTPSHVRQALDTITGNNEIMGFREGSMACAQETFEEILRYLHREYIKPNYYEKYYGNPEKLKKKEEEYEDTGCNMDWVSHDVFGLEIIENLECHNCGYISEVQSSHIDFLINLYSEELLDLKYSQSDRLDTLVSRMYKRESYERKTEPKTWPEWRTATLEPKQMNLCSEPDVFTFAIHWVSPDSAERDEIKRVFQFISPLIDINKFMKTNSSETKSSTYVFRGFVSYYGKHYMAYFYSEKHDYWMHLNDSKITKVGDFKDVIDKWLVGKELPILLFYEKLGFLEEVLPESKSEKAYFRPKEFLKSKNNFWFVDKNFKKELKKRGKYNSDCTIF